VSLDRPVVLIVDRDADTRDRVVRWLEDAGLDVVACPGPTAPEFTCVGSRDGHCPLAQEADLIVLDLWLDSDAAMVGTRAWNLVRFYRYRSSPETADAAAASRRPRWALRQAGRVSCRGW
jgi:CheY-like chemotaxis protein